MALKSKLTADEHGKLDEARRKDYVADGSGGFILDVEPVDGVRLENVDGLSSAKRKIQAERDELREAMKAFDGLDPAAARAALEKLKTAGDGDGKASEKLEAARRLLQEEFGVKEKAYQAQMQAVESQLQRHLIESSAAQVLAKHKGDAALLMPHIERAAKVVKDEKGKYKIKVVDSDGQPMASKLSNRGGEDMELDELVSGEFKRTFAAAFEGTNSSGSGATGSNRTAGPGRFTLTQDQARDPMAYQSVKAEAAKAGQQVSIVG